MIVLGKSFLSNDYPVMIPIGIVKDNKVKIVEEKNKIEKFPNNGRIFTPKIFQKISTGNFNLYQLEVSHTYQNENPNSSYYSVIQLGTDYPLFEIYDLKEGYETDTEKIVQKILNGFTNKVEPLREILFRTSDDYLIGPFKSEYNLENRHVSIIDDFEIDKFLIPVYSNREQQISITFYFDEFEGIERAFAITYPEDKHIVDKLDIGSKDYIVREAIKFLKGNEEFGDITRRVTRNINDWLKSATFSKNHNMRRLIKAVQLIEQVTPEEEEYKDYRNYLMSLPSLQKEIDKMVDQRFKKEYENFKQENNKLINENNNFKTEFAKLKGDVQLKEMELKELSSELKKYMKFMSDKKDSLESDLLEYYFQKLISNNLLHIQKESEPENIMFERKGNSFETFETIENIQKNFKYNLKQVSERDTGNFILDYILINLKFNQPLIIVGPYSFKLADLILKTFSSAKSRTFIPENPEFSLSKLYRDTDETSNRLDFTHIHNIHVSSASLNLNGFLNAYELLNNENKIIFTFDSFEESRFVLEQLSNYSILNVSTKTFAASPFAKKTDFKLGQINREILYDELQPKIEFEESLERLIVSNEVNPDLQVELETSQKKVVYMNQLLDNPKKVMKYFPFLHSRQIGEVNE